MMQIKELNKGAHGVVVLAESLESGEKVAIKLIKRGPEMVSQLRSDRDCR